MSDIKAALDGLMASFKNVGLCAGSPLVAVVDDDDMVHVSTEDGTPVAVLPAELYVELKKRAESKRLPDDPPQASTPTPARHATRLPG